MGSVTVRSCIFLYQVSEDHQATNLKQYCLKVISDNWVRAAAHQTHLTLTLLTPPTPLLPSPIPPSPLIPFSTPPTPLLSLLTPPTSLPHDPTHSSPPPPLSLN